MIGCPFLCKNLSLLSTKDFATIAQIKLNLLAK